MKIGIDIIEFEELAAIDLIKYSSKWNDFM